jgi:hypothetical protein
MVAVNPKLEGKKMILRKSMVKYSIPDAPPEHRTLEVIKPSRALRGSLNRQFITLLHALGIPKEDFLKLQQGAVCGVRCAVPQLIPCVVSLEYIDWLLSCDKDKDELKGFINSHEAIGDDDSIQTEIKHALLAGHALDEPYLKGQIMSMKKMKLVRTRLWRVLVRVLFETAHGVMAPIEDVAIQVAHTHRAVARSVGRGRPVWQARVRPGVCMPEQGLSAADRTGCRLQESLSPPGRLR